MTQTAHRVLASAPPLCSIPRPTCFILNTHQHSQVEVLRSPTFCPGPHSQKWPRSCHSDVKFYLGQLGETETTGTLQTEGPERDAGTWRARRTLNIGSLPHNWAPGPRAKCKTLGDKASLSLSVPSSCPSNSLAALPVTQQLSRPALVLEWVGSLLSGGSADLGSYIKTA